MFDKNWQNRIYKLQAIQRNNILKGFVGGKQIVKGNTEEKIAKVMNEFQEGKLKTSAGDIVTDADQAIAIALEQAGVSEKATNYDELVKMCKSKLDSVGSEDADVDNDGDVDSSDEYLKTRRKKISENVKKAYEVLGLDADVEYDTDQDYSTISKGKKLPIGTIRTHGNNKVIKTAKGWRPYKDGSGNQKTQESEAGKSEEEIINGKGSKSDKARALHDIGMSTSDIAKKLDMHYSHAYSTIKKHKASKGQSSQTTKPSKTVKPNKKAVEGKKEIKSNSKEAENKIQDLLSQIDSLSPKTQFGGKHSKRLAQEKIDSLEDKVDELLEKLPNNSSIKKDILEARAELRSEKMSKKEVRDIVEQYMPKTSGDLEHDGRQEYDEFSTDRFAAFVARDRRIDHGGGADKEGWLSQDEVRKLIDKHEKQWAPKMEEMKKKLERRGLDMDWEVDYGEKGHVHLEVTVKSGQDSESAKMLNALSDNDQQMIDAMSSSNPSLSVKQLIDKLKAGRKKR